MCSQETQWASDVDRWSGDAGATAVEYALMVSFITIVIVAAVTLIGTTLAGIFATMAAGL